MGNKRQSGKYTKHHRTDAKKSTSHKNTARNKIKRIEKSLKTAGGQAKNFLLERLEFWKSKL